MEVKQEFTLNGEVIHKTNDQFMGLHVYIGSEEDCERVVHYLVDSKKNVKGVITVMMEGGAYGLSFSGLDFKSGKELT